MSSCTSFVRAPSLAVMVPSTASSSGAIGMSRQFVHTDPPRFWALAQPNVAGFDFSSLSPWRTRMRGRWMDSKTIAHRGEAPFAIV